MLADFSDGSPHFAYSESFPKGSFTVTPTETPVTVPDIGAKTIRIDGDATLLSITLAQEKFSAVPLNRLLSGEVAVRLNGDSGPIYERAFFNYAGSARIQYSSEILDRINNPVFVDRNSATLYAPVKEVVRADSFSDEILIAVESQARKSFDETWGSQCNIQLRFSSVQKYTDDSRFGYSWMIAFSPEVIYLLDQIKAADPESSRKINLFTGFHLRWSNSLGPSKGYAEGVALEVSKWKHDEFISEASQLADENFILVDDFGRGHTIAHEIGHIILQQGHDKEENHLMSVGAQGDFITPEQCARARTYIVNHYQN